MEKKVTNNDDRKKAKAEFIKEFEKQNYKKIMVRLRLDIDKELIDYLEEEKAKGVGTTEIIRDALWKAYLDK